MCALEHRGAIVTETQSDVPQPVLHIKPFYEKQAPQLRGALTAATRERNLCSKDTTAKNKINKKSGFF